ncbi:MAG: CDP-alcohol phosphatidyltransferase family protein [Deltaproteobacteria bacterium]|nr:CDP-alcohol phosphatidyltransferase family protein [Deltaproteobacteria bacterium]
MLIVDFTQTPQNIPFVKVLGLTVAERHALAAQSAGCDEVLFVMPGATLKQAQDVVEKHPRLKIPVGFTDTMPHAASNAWILSGDIILTSQGMKGLMDGTYNMAAMPGKYKSTVTAENVGPVETTLLKSLVKDADGVVSRNINRKISLFISKRLARYSVVPNQVTAVVFLIGILSGPLAFFMNSYWGFTLGALCYYVSAILDGCDGEISRLKYLGSPFGAWMDTVVDDLVGLSYILGLYGRLALDTDSMLWTVVGATTISMYMLTILPRYWVMARNGSGDFQKLAAQKKPKEIRGFMKVVEGVRNVIFRTDFLPFFAFVTAASGFVLAFAIPFAAGSLASAIDSIIDTIRVKKIVAAKTVAP